MHSSTGSSTQLWQQELEDLAIASCAAPAAAEVRMFRSLLKLLSNYHDRRMTAGLSMQTSDSLDLALDNGFADTAILRLISADSAFMISHDGNQMFIASICLPGASEETTANGATLALAMIGAICMSLADRLAPASRMTGSAV